MNEVVCECELADGVVVFAALKVLCGPKRATERGSVWHDWWMGLLRVD